MLVYVLCLLLLGLLSMTMEFAIGRAAQASPVGMYQKLEKPGQKWHIHGWFCLLGNVALMAFYTVVTGWMIYYFVMFLIGKSADLTFVSMITNPGVNVIYLAVAVAVGFLVLSFELQGGLEAVTKYMMSALLILMLVLAVHSGLIIFPACFTYGMEVDAGPSLLFNTMATVFNNMAGGRADLHLNVRNRGFKDSRL